MRPDDDEQIRALFQAVFGQALPAEVWRWKYGRYGLAYVYEEDGRILSHCGALAHDLAWRGDGHLAYTVGDVMTHPDVRLRRLFPQTALELFRQHADNQALLVYGFPAPRVFKMQVRLLGVEAIGPVYSLSKRLRPNVSRGIRRIAVSRRPPRHWDHAWGELERNFGLISRRTHDRLAWRYQQRPDRTYRFVSLPDRPALGVLGLGGDHAYVMEFFTAPGAVEDAERLLDAIEKVAVKRGAEELAAWFPKASWAARCLADGGGYTGREADHFFSCTRRDPRLELDWLAEHFFYSLGDWDVH